MKKIWLTLGTVVSTAAPIAAVISCGVETITPTKSNLELNNYIKSTKFSDQLETEWQHRLLTGELGHKTFDFTEKDGTETDLTLGLKVMNINAHGNEALKEALQYELTFNTNKDSSYIRKLGERILSLNSNVKSDDLFKEGLLTDYHHGQLEFATTNSDGTKVTDKALNLIFNTKVLSLRNLVYRQIIVHDYLATNKSDWAKAFKKENDNLTVVEKMIDADNFVLIKELVQKRYFAKWEVALDDKTGNYYHHAVATQAELFTSMTTDGTVGDLGKLLSRSDAKAHLNPEVFSFGSTEDAKLKPLGAFKGFGSMAKSVKDFAFDDASFKSKTTEAMWSGFVQENELKDSDIKYTDEKTPNKIKVTYVRGLMPIYKAAAGTDPEKLILGSNLSSAAGKKLLIHFLASNDPSLYHRAMAYYTTKRGDKAANVLTIPNEEIRRILRDKGIKFIEERKQD